MQKFCSESSYFPFAIVNRRFLFRKCYFASKLWWKGSTVQISWCKFLISGHIFIGDSLCPTVDNFSFHLKEVGYFMIAARWLHVSCLFSFSVPFLGVSTHFHHCNFSQFRSISFQIFRTDCGEKVSKTVWTATRIKIVIGRSSICDVAQMETFLAFLQSSHAK